MSTTDDTPETPERHGGPIDPYSPYRLEDIVNGELNDPMYDSFEYHGFHLGPMGDGRLRVQLDGHAGLVDTLDLDDYDRVDELVADLNRLLVEVTELHHIGDREDLVEYAGKIMTGDKEKAEESDHHVFVPPHFPDRGEDE